MDQISDLNFFVTSGALHGRVFPIGTPLRANAIECKPVSRTSALFNIRTCFP